MIKRIGQIMLAAGLLIGAFANQTAAQESNVAEGAKDTVLLTLDDAYTIAASENLTVRIADQEITKQSYEKRGAYASLIPQVDFSFNFERAIKKRTIRFNGQSAQMGALNTFTTGFVASMPIINVGLWKELQITGENVELAVEKARSSKVALVEQVRKAYYGVLLAKDVYKVYKENYDRAVDNYNNVKAKYDNGTVAQYDLIRAQVSVDNAKPNVYDSQNAIALAQWRLKAVIGMDLDTPISCAGSLMDYVGELENISQYNNASLEGNSQLKQLDIQSRISSKNIQSKIAKYYPTLSANISYYWLAQEENLKLKDYSWDPLSTGTIALTIPIFSGGKRYYDVKKARIEKRQLDMQAENTERELKVQVMQILNTLETNSAQYASASSAVNGAEKGYEISSKRYEIGSGTQLELTDAQVALLESQLNRSQSVYNFLSNKAGLDNILGTNLPDCFKEKGIVIHNEVK